MVCFATWRVEDGLSPIGQSVTEIDVWPNSTGQITAQRDGTPAYSVDVTAYVIEFGSDTTVYKGTWAMTSAETSDTGISIGGTVTLANTFGWHYGESEDGGTATWDSDPDGRNRKFEFASTTTLDISRAAAKGAKTGHWFVVESSTLSVQHETEDFLANGSLTHIHDITSAVTHADTFVLVSHTTTEDAENDLTLCHELYDDEGQDTIRSRRAFGNPTDTSYAYQIVTDSALTVQRGDFTSATSPDSASISAVNLSYAIVKQPSCRSGEEAGNYYASGTIDARYTEMWLSSTTQVDGRQGAGGASRTIPWEVIEFPSDATAPRRVMVSG
jgi:hypothetical protein